MDIWLSKEEFSKRTPPPPFLFVWQRKLLSCGISFLVDNNLLLPMAGTKGVDTSTHVLYADDIFVFFFFVEE